MRTGTCTRYQGNFDIDQRRFFLARDRTVVAGTSAASVSPRRSFLVIVISGPAATLSRTNRPTIRVSRARTATVVFVGGVNAHRSPGSFSGIFTHSLRRFRVLMVVNMSAATFPAIHIITVSIPLAFLMAVPISVSVTIFALSFSVFLNISVSLTSVSVSVRTISRPAPPVTMTPVRATVAPASTTSVVSVPMARPRARPVGRTSFVRFGRWVNDPGNC